MESNNSVNFKKKRINSFDIVNYKNLKSVGLCMKLIKNARIKIRHMPHFIHFLYNQ